MPPQLRQLAVTVAEARGLLAGDRNGLSDPFVELSARDARGARLPLAGSFSTPVARRTLSPVWNARFSLGSATSFSSSDGGGGSSFDLRLATSLRFLVYDYDALKFNDVLGEVDMPLAIVEKALADCSEQDGVKELDAWYKVTKVPGAMTADATGELRLVFSVVSTSSASNSMVAPPPDPTALSTSADHPPNVLFVTVEAARGLLAMDKDTSSSDPLVKLALHGQRRETCVVRESLKPHWDETFSFLLPPTPKRAGKKAENQAPIQLELLVEDEDRGALRNDFLGRALVPVPTVATTGGGQEDEWVVTVPLLDRKLRADKPRGALRLRLQRVFDPRARRVVAAMDKKRGSSKSGRSSSSSSASRPGMLMALQHSMRVRMAPDQEEEETDDEDGDTIEEEGEGDQEDDSNYSSAGKDDDWLMAPYTENEQTNDDDGDETVQETTTTTTSTSTDDRLLSFVVVTVHAVEALPSMDAVVLFDSTSYASTSAWGPTCTSGSVGGAVDVYVTASLADDESAPARTRVKSVFGSREQLRARFRDRLMVFTGDAAIEPSTKKSVVLTVMDWDPVGEDELVGRVELTDVDSLVGRAPFWINLYGAPTGSGSVSSSASGKAAAERMNVRPTLGSAFRGRICVSLALSTKRADAFEPKHQTCRIVKPLSSRLRRATGGSITSKPTTGTSLPVRLPWPETSVFKLRAHFVRAEGVPVVSSSLPAAALVVSCGLSEVGSSARRIVSTASKTSGAVEWNDIVESDRFALPTDVDQMPDVFLYLSYTSDSTGRTDGVDAKSRKQAEPVCFKRIPAKSLLVGDDSTISKPHWVSLSGDRAVDKVRGRDSFPGAALVRLELLPWSDADAHPTREDQEDGKPAERWSSDVERLVNARAPYQVRVRVEGVRNLVRDDADATANSGASTHVVVQCGDQEDTVQLAAAASSKVICLDLQLPPTLLFAPRVLLHVRSGGKYVGSAALPLFGDENVGPRGVAECSREDLDKAALPPSRWLTITANGLEDGVVGQVGAAALLVRKAFPDEVLPSPTDV